MKHDKCSVHCLVQFIEWSKQIRFRLWTIVLLYKYWQIYGDQKSQSLRSDAWQLRGEWTAKLMLKQVSSDWQGNLQFEERKKTTEIQSISTFSSLTFSPTQRRHHTPVRCSVRQRWCVGFMLMNVAWQSLFCVFLSQQDRWHQLVHKNHTPKINSSVSFYTFSRRQRDRGREMIANYFIERVASNRIDRKMLFWCFSSMKRLFGFNLKGKTTKSFSLFSGRSHTFTRAHSMK